ncbi:MAG: glycine--tRNA ligase subunit beta [Kangiellaceae bacterium]|nr:glycine--tRNA ligase subunit beta [Kangiellaceae bacterium]|tara:strand:- start:65 stop:2143 length:2079 start_codon:yes stop_codon:yes gene_type:complete
MSTQDLLFELGTEELPPTQIKTLGQSLCDNVQAELERLNLGFSSIKWLATPRRLALIIRKLEEKQQDREVEKRGPALKAAYDADGNPTKAAEGFARSVGATVDQLQTIETPKGAWLSFTAQEVGQTVEQLIQEIIDNAIKKLPIAKPMRWANNDYAFIRPAHWLIVLFGERVLPCSLFGLQSNNISRGHRFMCDDDIVINTPASYEEQLLKEGNVLADFELRRQRIKSQIEDAAREAGGVPVSDAALLDEVTGLVEMPYSMVGTFEEKYLDVPPEPLIYTMKDNQKYFPVVTPSGSLLNKFVFVSNIYSEQPEKVIDGNERVVRPRLADAEFFFNTDKKVSLESRRESTKTVVFQTKLGTLFDKSERVAVVARHIANAIKADPNEAQRAGELSKSDLMTDMVFEFTEVQGVMGMHYAKHDGESDAVANALNEQYYPRFSGDKLPAGDIGTALSLADKLDTLVGIFGIGQKPKADKDPFALRRAAIGVLRILVEKSLDLDVVELLETAKAQFHPEQLSNASVIDDVFGFMLARFNAWYQEQGVETSLIQAVMARRPSKPLDFDRRVKAVADFYQLPDAAGLAAANKRVSNILAKQEQDVIKPAIDNALLSEEAEKVLADKVASLQQEVAPLFEEGNYQQALRTLSQIRPDVDSFFDQVMVNADDEAVKANRLTLLKQLRDMFLTVADISLLQH